MNRILMLSSVFLALFVATAAARAAITVAGDVSPSSTTTWTNPGVIAYVGYNTGAGSVTVTPSSILYSNACYLGYSSVGAGTVTVNGTGAQWITSSSTISGNSGPVYVGNYGSGAVYVQNGGSVTFGATSYIGYGANGAGTVTVDNAGLIVGGGTSSGCLYVGNNGSGTLYIQNGGVLASGGSALGNYIGYGGTGTGVVTISGSGSRWGPSGPMRIGAVYTFATLGAGDNASGTLNLVGGATIATSGIITGGTSASSAMTVNFDGGAMTADFSLSNSTWIMAGAGASNVYIKDGGASFNTNGDAMGIGIALQHGGGAAIDGGLTKTGAGTLTLSGNDTYTGNTTVSQGTLTINGSTLMDINDPGAGYSKFLGSGTLNLNGALKLDVADVTDTSDTWQLVAASGLTKTYGGSFAVELADGTPFAPSGATWTYTQASRTWTFDESNGVLSLTASTPPLPGDANEDGNVDGTDLNTVLSNYGMTSGATWAMGDFNGDGAVDGSDLNTVLSNYGMTSHAAAAVPEPCTLGLLILGVLGMLGYAWRKRIR